LANGINCPAYRCQQVWQRIKNFRNGTVFRNINAQLPVLQQTLERIQTAQKHGSFDSDTQQALSEPSMNV
jgi:hypothetical protein